MKQELPNIAFALPLLLFAMLFIACAQDNPRPANEKKVATPQTKKEFSLGDNTNSLSVEEQLQRYNAGLESMERYLTENAGKMSPHIEQELKDKIESAKSKIDSLTKMLPQK